MTTKTITGNVRGHDFQHNTILIKLDDEFSTKDYQEPFLLSRKVKIEVDMKE